jgi:ribosomal protein S18 acetylase RimI-like enzyme
MNITTPQLPSIHQRQHGGTVPSIRRAKRGDLREIVELHRIALPDFFLVTPGTAFLRAFYSFLISDRNGLLLVSEQGGSFGGFAAALTGWERLLQRLPPNGLRLLPTVAACLFRRPTQLPGLVKDLYRAAHSTQDRCHSNESACDLVAIAVEPRFRRQGHGTELLQSILAVARAGAMSQLRVRFDSADVGMQSFYRHLGFAARCMPGLSDGRRMIEYALSLKNESSDSHVNSQS